MYYDNMVGSVEYSDADRVWHGKIEGIADLITYEAKTLEGLTIAFRSVVNRYILELIMGLRG